MKLKVETSLFVYMLLLQALLLDKQSYPIKHLELVDCSIDLYPLHRLAK